MHLDSLEVVEVQVTHFSDPGCPWAYSASPAHAVLRWRYGAQLQWRLVTDRADRGRRAVHPPRLLAGALRRAATARFRRRGMPFATQPRPRMTATGRACRAIVATRLQRARARVLAFRALQFGWFTTPLCSTTTDDLGALARSRGSTSRVVAALDGP